MDLSNDALALQIAHLAIGSESHDVKILQLPQTIHRLAIIEAWKPIKPGYRILELGCGQGDMTAVLASLVGPSGHVVALDPADPDSYGSPWTLKQAQDHLSSSEIGARINWVKSDTLKYLEKTEEKFDAVVLAQCLWYFPSIAAITDTFRMIKKLKGSPTLLMAEYALESQHPEAMPHILAAFAQAALEVCKETSISNIRTLVSPASLRKLAEDVGWKLVSEQKITPNIAYQDARWEIETVLHESFLKEVDGVVHEERQKAVVHGLRDALISSSSRFGRKNWRSMDVWAASFE
jgi:ubiquinone/menaquinone biosynthesis C-methylase UbiE